MLKLLSVLLLVVSARADTIQVFTNRAAWTAAVRAHDAADKIETERFNHDQIHTGITLQSIPIFPEPMTEAHPAAFRRSRTGCSAWVGLWLSDRFSIEECQIKEKVIRNAQLGDDVDELSDAFVPAAFYAPLQSSHYLTYCYS